MSDAEDKDRALREAIKDLLTAKHVTAGYIGIDADIQAVILDIEKVRTKLGRPASPHEQRMRR